jgi:hypothetical protein
MNMKHICLFIAFVAVAWDSHGEDAPMSASDLAHKLSALQQNGTSFVRLRLEIQQPPGTKTAALQLQIKQRRTAALTEIVYQVLWPKERNGEAVLLRKAANQAPTCSVFTPPNTLRVLSAAQMKEGMFGSDLSYADVTENFFAWDQQAIVGTDMVNRVSCQILESRAGKGDTSTFAVVRSWVDVQHLVPMRVEKYSPSGKVGRRIDTTRTSSDGGHRVPANLTVQGARAGSMTVLEGSSIEHGVGYDQRTFTAEGLKDMTAPRSAK